ncbi:hypothetical protein ACFYKX_11140 [Cytobacillus sp. FJAT-54145]|uniref:Uncharacterized protein n=1 Tax=Cytobacillus spartinae TaxID=3299023 RepID=A0ABW6KAF4_9BACI
MKKSIQVGAIVKGEFQVTKKGYKYLTVMSVKTRRVYQIHLNTDTALSCAVFGSMVSGRFRVYDTQGLYKLTPVSESSVTLTMPPVLSGARVIKEKKRKDSLDIQKQEQELRKKQLMQTWNETVYRLKSQKLYILSEFNTLESVVEELGLRETLNELKEEMKEYQRVSFLEKMALAHTRATTSSKDATLRYLRIFNNLLRHDEHTTRDYGEIVKRFKQEFPLVLSYFIMSTSSARWETCCLKGITPLETVALVKQAIEYCVPATYTLHHNLKNSLPFSSSSLHLVS